MMRNGAQAGAIEAKLRAARARLCMDKPFLGALVVHLPFERASWCPTIATDARRLYFNAHYIERLSFAETQFALAHTALHCALGHFARRGHRLRRRWEVACDHAVNRLLVDDGLQAPTGALLDVRFRGMSAEEIYPLIAVDPQERPLDLHVFDRCLPTLGEPSDGSSKTAGNGATSADVAADAVRPGEQADPAEGAREHDNAPPIQALLHVWQMRLATAAQQAERAGCLARSWQRALGRLLEPCLPWRALLARYLAAVARDDYSFQRPSRREGAALLPSLHSQETDISIVLDTSGSIAEGQLREFVTETDALKAQLRARVTLHACDDALSPHGPWFAEPWQRIAWPETLTGGGGTDFRPIFDWIQCRRQHPDVLIYFTDAKGEFPSAPPPYPVLWLVKGRNAVPWGERIQLN